MFRKIKRITLQMIAGANIATIILMLLIGYSDYINPASHPYMACAGLLFPIFLFINLLFLIFWAFFHVRGIWIPILGYFICYAPLRIYFPINTSKDTPADAIKILSYNVMSFAPDSVHSDGTNPVLEYIKNSDADIVCLQEATPAWGQDASVDSVMSKYKYQSKTILNKGNIISVYSRYPILSKERIWYESENNGSAAYKLKIGNDTVIVINNHLENCHLNHGDRRRYKEMLKGDMENDTARAESKRLLGRLADAVAIRSHQADAVVKYINDHKGKSIILCGDFNDNPISYAHRVISAHLTDCYVTTGNGIGLSYNKKGFFVRIDNIMCSDDWMPFGCKVDSKISASDHYPIYCWLKKGPKP